MKYKPILITGYTGSGKSTIASKYEYEDRYYRIDMDQIIKNVTIPKYGENDVYYAQKYLISYIKRTIIKNNGKVVVEGQLRCHRAIREIFGKNEDFEFYVVRPPNVTTYIQRLTSQFVKDPDNYGRLGFPENDGVGGKALEDYKQNGIQGKFIKDRLKKIGKDRFPKHEELYESYLPEFKPIILIN